MSLGEPPLKVIYITGFGHNGSTLLDTMLGNHPDVLSVGEIIHFPYGLIEDMGQRCGCGRLAHECPVWHEVIQRWVDAIGLTNVETYKRLGYKFARRRSWNTILKGAASRNPDFNWFASCTAILYRLLAEISGKSVIVDSSKPAPRGLAIAQIPGLDIRAIHLVRDVRGGAWSYLRRKSWAKNPLSRLGLSAAFCLRSALGWHLENWAADRLRAWLGPDRSVLIRYEDLIAEPVEAMQKILALCDLGLDALPDSLWHSEIPNKGHIMWGNDNRIQPTYRLKLDTAWKESLPALDRALIMAVSRRRMHRYGYE